MTRSTDVRALSIADLEAALALSSAAGWNQRLDDWRMLLTLAPSGSFAAVHGGRLVGTAVGIDYGTFGWIAMMLVDPDWRGQGVGVSLLEAAIGALPPHRPIRLDATPLGRPLYQRHGFEDETTLTRHVLAPSADHRRPDARPNLSPIRALTADDLPWLAATDDAVFGARRNVLLDWMLDASPNYAFAVERAGVPGYCFGRQGRLFDQIGPVVAGDDETARALVGASLSAAGDRAVVVDAFDRETTFTAWLRSCGFTGERPLFRMSRPGQDGGVAIEASNRSLREFAILGPEFG